MGGELLIFYLCTDSFLRYDDKESSSTSVGNTWDACRWIVTTIRQIQTASWLAIILVFGEGTEPYLGFRQHDGTGPGASTARTTQPHGGGPCRSGLRNLHRHAPTECHHRVYSS